MLILLQSGALLAKRMLAKDPAARLFHAGALCRLLAELESFPDPSFQLAVPSLGRISAGWRVTF